MTNAMARALQAGREPVRFTDDGNVTRERTTLARPEEYARHGLENPTVHEPWQRYTCRRKGNTGGRVPIRTDRYGAMRGQYRLDRSGQRASSDPWAAAREAERKRKKIAALRRMYRSLAGFVY